MPAWTIYMNTNPVPTHLGIEEPAWASTPEGIRNMRHVAFDFETFISRQGLKIPQWVVVGLHEVLPDGTERTWASRDYDEIGAFLLDALCDPRCHLINQNIRYDMAVLAEFWPHLQDAIMLAYREGRVHCTMIRQMLIYLAQGRFEYDWKYGNRRVTYSLAELSLEYLGLDLFDEKKNPDAWRLRYHQLYDVPLEDWPQDALTYVKSDPVIAYKCFWAQSETAPTSWWEGSDIAHPNGWVRDAVPRARKAYALTLTSARGLRTEKASAKALRLHLENIMGEHTEYLERVGFLRENPKVKSGWSKNTREIAKRVYHMLNGEVTLTNKGKELLDEGYSMPENPDSPGDDELDVYRYTSTAGAVLDSDRCRKDEALRRLSDWRVAVEELTKFIPTVEAGTEFPLCSKYWPMLATGRVSTKDPNTLNMPRRSGVRECFVPRPGYSLVAIDYDSLEVRCWAEACMRMVGRSTAAEKYLEDPHWDPHSYFAAVLAGVTYEEFLAVKRDKNHPNHAEYKDLRQTAKVPNFGLPGGMAALTLVEYGWDLYRIEIKESTAKELAQTWKELYPEHEAYFNVIKQALGDDQLIASYGSNRLRGDIEYCSGANNLFQAPAADIFLKAMADIQDEVRTDPTSPAYGSYPVAAIHDEGLFEVPTEKLHEASMRLRDIMVDAGMAYMDVPLTAEPAAMKRWYKSAEAVYDEQGKLTHWSPDA